MYYTDRWMLLSTDRVCSAELKVLSTFVQFGEARNMCPFAESVYTHLSAPTKEIEHEGQRLLAWNVTKGEVFIPVNDCYSRQRVFLITLTDAFRVHRVFRIVFT
jgi:hypothetical protein